MMPVEIAVSDSDGVRCLTIDRPAKRNALTRPMMKLLADAVADAGNDASVRVILLGSEGDHFCAGADLDGLASGPLNDGNDPGYEFFQRLVEARKPLVCAVQGPAIGMAVTMLLHFDLIFAAPEALFCLPFADLGLTPEGGSSFLLPERAGIAKAARLLLLGEPFTAREALDCGLVSEVVPRAKLWERARSAAGSLARKPHALAQTKAMMRRAGTIADMDREQAIFREALAGDEFRFAVERMRFSIGRNRRSANEIGSSRLEARESWAMYLR